MDAALVENFTRVRVAASLWERDPLQFWHFAVPRLRDAFGLFTAPNPIDELHGRGPNKGTKTQSLAAFVNGCCQKRESLDGVVLPQWRGAVEAAQLVLDYPQQILSVQAAYLKVLGQWPHHARYDGETLKSLRIKPLGGSDEQSTWSVIHFLSQKNLTSGKGVRADIVAFDEPPVMEILQELRKAAHAGRRGIRIIMETPTKRREWAPLREDYGDSPRASLRRVDRTRAEVRWNLDEVADWCLSRDEKERMRESYQRDPLLDARWHGDYTNTEGKCPLDAEVLAWLIGECVTPQIEQWRVALEMEESGRTASITKVPVEIFRTPDKVEAAYIDIDPASGVDDARHNPAGLHVSEMGSGDLLARWNGYLPPYSLGVLAAGLARQYRNAAIDIEMKDHWGVNVLRGVQASRYGNVCFEQRELRPGQWAKEAGFDATEEARAIWIGGIQEWLAAWRAAARFGPDGSLTGFGPGTYAKCPSRAVLECLLDTELDERGKIVAGPGVAHGEDMVLWGQKLRRAVRRSSREIPETYAPERGPDAALIEAIRGNGKEPERGPAMPRPRQAPRI